MSRGNRTNHHFGMAHPKARLSDEDVREMRRRRATETPRPSYLALALDFDCGETTVRNICNGITRVCPQERAPIDTKGERIERPRTA